MKDEYIYCALNDCNINKGYSKCCHYCDDEKCPDRCDKKDHVSCICLMKGLKEEQDRWMK